MFCIRCGAQIDDDAQFCTACGAPVNEVVSDALTDDASAWQPEQPLQQPVQQPAPEYAQQPTQQYPVYAPAAPSQAPKKRGPLVIALAIILAVVVVAAVLFALISFDVIPNPFAQSETATEQVAEPDAATAEGNGLGGDSASDQGTVTGLGTTGTADTTTANAYVGGPADYYYFEFPGYRNYDQSVASDIGWGIFTYGIPTGGFEVVEASWYDDGLSGAYHARLYNADQAFSLAFDATHNGATTLDYAYSQARGNHAIDYEWTNGVDKYVVSYYSGEWEYYICGYVNGSHVVQMVCEYPAANEGTCNQWVESIYDSFKLL